MASSTMSYHRSTSLASSSDPELQTQLQQARQQRTGFYRRLADAGSRIQAPAGDRIEPADDDVYMDTSTRRRRQRLESLSPHADLVSSTHMSPVDPLPEPRSSWRYYTSYDNGEWRRHATPMYKADAELDASGIRSKLPERRTASLSGGLTTSREVDIEENDGDARPPLSALARHQQRLRGSACLTQNLQNVSSHSQSAAAFNTTDTGPTTLEEVKLVMNDVFDRSRYGTSSDVSELVQKVLKERLNDREPSALQTVDRVIYANPDRRTILDEASQPLRCVIPEIPEGHDESEFVERVLAPSGRRWTSSPSPDSKRVFVVKGMYGEDCFDSGMQYEDIRRAADVDAAGGRGTSLENWRDSTCRSPSNLAETFIEDAAELVASDAGWNAATLPNASRTVAVGKTTHQSVKRTFTDALPPSSAGVTATSQKDSLGRRIPTGAVEIKVEMQRKASDESYAQHGSPVRSRCNDEMKASFNENSSPTRRRADVGGSAYMTENQQEYTSARIDRSAVSNAAVTPRTSSFAAGDWSQNKAGPSSDDDGRIWVPVIHVSGSSGSKTEVESDTRTLARHPIQADSRSDVAMSSSTSDRDGGGPTGFRSKPVVVSSHHQDISNSRELKISPICGEESSEESRTGISPGSQSLRVGSGIGSYGYRSSIVVDRGGSSPDARSGVIQTSSSYSSEVTPARQTARDCDWIVEKAL